MAYSVKYEETDGIDILKSRYKSLLNIYKTGNITYSQLHTLDYLHLLLIKEHICSSSLITTNYEAYVVFFNNINKRIKNHPSVTYYINHKIKNSFYLNN